MPFVTDADVIAMWDDRDDETWNPRSTRQDRLDYYRRKGNLPWWVFGSFERVHRRSSPRVRSVVGMILLALVAWRIISGH